MVVDLKVSDSVMQLCLFLGDCVVVVVVEDGPQKR